MANGWYVLRPWKSEPPSPLGVRECFRVDLATIKIINICTGNKILITRSKKPNQGGHNSNSKSRCDQMGCTENSLSSKPICPKICTDFRTNWFNGNAAHASVPNPSLPPPFTHSQHFAKYHSLIPNTLQSTLWWPCVLRLQKCVLFYRVRVRPFAPS